MRTTLTLTSCANSSMTTSTASSTLCAAISSPLCLNSRPLRSVTGKNTHPKPIGTSARSSIDTKRSCQSRRSWAFRRRSCTSCSENSGRRAGFAFSESRSRSNPSRGRSKLVLSGGPVPGGNVGADRNEDREDGNGRERARLEMERADGEWRDSGVGTGPVSEGSCSR